MIIYYGSRLYGKVDEVPDMFYVATKFGHLYFIPLIPLGSQIIFEETSDGWRGAPIGLSLKSVLVAWVRAATILGTIAFLIGTVANFAEGSTMPAITCMMGFIGSIVLFCITKAGFVQRASYERACNLAMKAGLPQEFQDMLKLAYGRVQSEGEAMEIADRLGLEGEEEEQGF